MTARYNRPLMRAARALRNAFLSPGRRLFGLRFSRDYLRFAVTTARRWGYAGPGTLHLLGFRLEYLNQANAVFLLHEIFVNAEYGFETPNPRPRIVDCGANIGTAVLFFKAVWPDAEVHAYEADPVTFAQLVRTIEHNGLRGVTPVNAVVGAVAGSTAFYSSPADPGSLTGSVDPSWGGAIRQELPAVRLSQQLNEPVDLLKLDIEGAEYDVVADLVESGAIRWVREAAIEHHVLPGRPDALTRMKAALEAAGFDVQETAAGGMGTGMIRARRIP
jgi:FkbM family methyltransferase